MSKKQTQGGDAVTDGFAEIRKQFEKWFDSKGVEIYERKTVEYGNIQAAKHKLGERTFIQNEMNDGTIVSVGELLIESDIFGAIQVAGGGINIDPGMIISHLVRKRLMHRFLTIVLEHEDGRTPEEKDFRSRGAEFLRFTKEVAAAFFTLNPDALKTIGAFLLGVFGTATVGGQLVAMVLAGRNSSGQSVSTGPKQGD